MKDAKKRFSRALVAAAVAAMALGRHQAAVAEEAADPAQWNDLPEEPYVENAPANPRIQFVMQAPGRERREIWSISLDGKDVRRFMGADLLYSGDAQRIDDPVRSPDGRYIACRGFTGDDVQIRLLVDRKTRTAKTLMSDAWGEAEFTWSPDSRTLYFYGGGEMWRYEVRSGALKKMPFIRASKLRIVDGGRRFLAALKAGVEYRDLSGKLVSSWKLSKPAAAVAAISLDGRRILYDAPPRVFVVNPAVPGKKLAEFEEGFSSVTFGPDESSLFFVRRGNLTRLDIGMRSLTALRSFPEIAHDLTLVVR